FERHFAHPVERVWNAITQPEQIAQWWLPFDADITLELVPGGKYELRSREDGFTLSWTVLRVERPTLFEHTHVDPGAAVRWELEPTHEGCKLVLTQSVPHRTAAVERGYIAGLHTSLERLHHALDGEPQPWDWERHHRQQQIYAAKGLARPPESEAR